jgi:hypothetical protein
LCGCHTEDSDSLAKYPDGYLEITGFRKCSAEISPEKDFKYIDDDTRKEVSWKDLTPAMKKSLIFASKHMLGCIKAKETPFPMFARKLNSVVNSKEFYFHPRSDYFEELTLTMHVKKIPLLMTLYYCRRAAGPPLYICKDGTYFFPKIIPDACIIPENLQGGVIMRYSKYKDEFIENPPITRIKK